MQLSDFLILLSFIFVACGALMYLYFSIFSKIFFQKGIKITPERASSFGEFVNGLTGPIFALSGFLIIYATIMDQNRENSLQHFESKLFKLLEFNRENSLQISIKSPLDCEEISGGAVWKRFYLQIRNSYQIIQSDTCLIRLAQNDKIHLAFATFYFGYSNTDSLRFHSVLDSFKLSPINKSNYIEKLKIRKTCSGWLSYFVGYSNKLGFFINQFFSTLNYIDKQNIINKNQKNEYAKMLTVQNDIYCQLVMYYYLQSKICTQDEIKLNTNYNLLEGIDSTLLFHLTLSQSED